MKTHHTRQGHTVGESAIAFGKFFFFHSRGEKTGLTVQLLSMQHAILIRLTYRKLNELLVRHELNDLKISSI